MRPVFLAFGTLVSVFALREMFHDLFHPSRSGSLSEFFAGTTFSLFRRRPSILTMAAPLALVLIITAWALLLSVGFALIYFALPATGFRMEPNTPSPHDGFWPALYFSLEVMTTLGLGDIKPAVDWLRVFVTLHTLIGFALVTASLTWIILIFPAISRVRSLATTASLLAEAEEKTGIRVVCEGAEDILSQFMAGVVMFRVDLIHFPIVFYFRSESDTACLARNLGLIDRFARHATQADQPERLKVAGAALNIALDHCAHVLAQRLKGVDPNDRIEVFKAYATHHARNLAQ